MRVRHLTPLAAAAALLLVAGPTRAQSLDDRAGDFSAASPPSEMIDPARGAGARGGGDLLQRGHQRRTLARPADGCTDACADEAELEDVRQCTLRCLEEFPPREPAPAGTALMGGGMLLTAAAAGTLLAGLFGFCEAAQGPLRAGEVAETGTCEAGFLVGGVAGMLLGVTLTVFGAERARPDRRGDSGLTWRF
jgi:hypothetical protein